MRAFLAFDLPGTFRDELDEITEQCANIIPRGIKWVPREQTHITLQFLGDVRPGDIRGLTQRFGEIVGGISPFMVANPVIEVVPSRNPNLVWVALNSDYRTVFSLPGRIRGEMESRGYQPDTKPLKLHITIGRVKVRGLTDDIGELVKLGFKTRSFTIDKVVFYKSELFPGGPEYTPIAEYALEQNC